MNSPVLIDLVHGGHPGIIAAYLVDTTDGPALVDCGPATAVPALKQGLDRYGLQVSDLRHVLVTHVHLDHAGAAGMLVRENPELLVHASAAALLHLAYPVALEHSARRIYGNRFDELWGELVEIPERNLRAVGDEAIGLECVATPGHTGHHVCYLDRNGVLYTGDAAGVRIAPSEHVTPPTVPPEFDLDAWTNSIRVMTRIQPNLLALTHFGVVSGAEEHFARLHRTLHDWCALVRGGAAEDEFVAVVGTRLGRDPGQEAYHRFLGLAPLYRGIRQYLDGGR